MSEAKTGGDENSGRSRRHARLEAFYRRYSPWLTTRLRGRFGSDTEDLVQEIWMRVEAIDADLDIRHPRAFLMKVAFNLGLSGDRQTRRRRQILDSALPLGSATVLPAQNAVVEIQQIVLALPQPLREERPVTLRGTGFPQCHRQPSRSTATPAARCRRPICRSCVGQPLERYLQAHSQAIRGPIALDGAAELILHRSVEERRAEARLRRPA